MAGNREKHQHEIRNCALQKNSYCYLIWGYGRNHPQAHLTQR
jgi:hypothetical protein